MFEEEKLKNCVAGRVTKASICARRVRAASRDNLLFSNFILPVYVGESIRQCRKTSPTGSGAGEGRWPRVIEPPKSLHANAHYHKHFNRQL